MRRPINHKKFGANNNRKRRFRAAWRMATIYDVLL